MKNMDVDYIYFLRSEENYSKKNTSAKTEFTCKICGSDIEYYPENDICEICEGQHDSYVNFNLLDNSQYYYEEDLCYEKI